jgi:hypothetical protein
MFGLECCKLFEAKDVTLFLKSYLLFHTLYIVFLAIPTDPPWRTKGGSGRPAGKFVLHFSLVYSKFKKVNLI